MSVINGQNADATTFNSAFASKSQDNTLQGKQTLARPGSGATVVDTQQAINDVIASDALKIPTAEKAVANGVATLDATTKVPVAQVPDLTASKITDFNTSADARITLQKGAPSGIAPLDGSSKIDSSYLPSYVDDVVEVANYASLPVTGETGKIYVTLDTNKTYRWSGSVYVQIGQPIASTSDVPEGTNLYYTPARVADKQIGIQFQDQGTNLGTTATVDTIDFIGAGIQATRASNKVTVEVTATGGGGGSKNYFSQSAINPDFETGTVLPWSAVKFTWDTIPNTPLGYSSPVNGSISVNAVNPLAGTQSMIYSIASNASPNSKYEGFISGSFFLDREDCGKVLYGSYSYQLLSGTVDFSGSSTQSLEIWIYNFVTGKWIQPSGWRGMNQTQGTGKVVFSFQSDSDPANNEYRIAILTQQASTNAYQVKFDTFSVGPQAIVLGSAMTDWQTYTPTFTGLGSPTAVGFAWRRVGDSIEIQGKFTVGTSTATEARIGLPSGLTVSDTTKIPSLSKVGSFSVSYIEAFSGEVLTEPSVSYLTLGKQGGGTPGLQKLNGNSVFSSSGQVCSLFARIPIQGFSSFSQMSSDTDTRVIVANCAVNTGTSVTSATPINFDSVITDNTGSVSPGTGTWKFTAPVSGFYEVSTSFATGVVNNIFQLFKNGSVYRQIGYTAGSSASNFTSSGSTIIQLNAGEYIDIRPNNTQTLTVGLGTGGTVSTANWISINRLSGPSVVTATESVTASYWASANVSSNPTTPINFDSKEYDSFNAVTTGAGWKFTAPVSGKYSVSIVMNQVSTVGSYLHIYKNGSIYKSVGTYNLTNAIQGIGSTDIHLNAGEYIDIRHSVTNTVQGGTLNATSSASNISIKRIGN